jgi:hypothetical protein
MRRVRESIEGSSRHSYITLIVEGRINEEVHDVILLIADKLKAEQGT